MCYIKLHCSITHYILCFLPSYVIMRKKQSVEKKLDKNKDRLHQNILKMLKKIQKDGGKVALWVKK